MDPALKHRLIGAAVLSALAIIFLPKLIVGHDLSSTAADVSLKMPNAPGGDFQTKELPLVTPATGVPQGGVVGMDASHPATAELASGAAQPVDANGQPRPAGEPAITQTASAPVAVTLPTTAAPSAPANVPPSIASAPVSSMPSLPIPAASAGGHYVVSLGTYGNAANAQSLVASLKAVQLPAYAESVTVAGKSATRVRIGPYGQRGDAEAARLKAQQVRTDMPASVTALDATATAPDTATAPTGKPISQVPATSGKPAAPATGTPSKPSPSATTTNALAAKAPPAPAAMAATAAATPATPSPAAAGRGFVVQLVAFRSQDEALTLRDKLRAAGFTAFSESIHVESGTLFRVRVGPQADREAADRVRAEVSAKLGLNGIVVAYP